jgi:hypothetical protein
MNIPHIYNSTYSDLKTLTKRDVCIVWGSPHDVGRYESNIGIRALKDFVNTHEHTNVFVINVPHRYDLAPTSCVNHEVKAFNRNLGKQKKVHKNLSVINVDLEREIYTRHGLHLNPKGKEQIANNVISVIKDLFHIKKAIPLAMKQKDVEVKDGEQSANKQLQGDQEIKESRCEKKVLPQENANSETGDQNKSETNKKLSVNKQIQEVQEIQESICENKATAREDVNSETKDQERTEEDLNQQVPSDCPVVLPTNTTSTSGRPKRTPRTRSDDFLWTANSSRTMRIQK